MKAPCEQNTCKGDVVLGPLSFTNCFSKFHLIKNRAHSKMRRAPIMIHFWGLTPWGADRQGDDAGQVGDGELAV